MALLEIKDLHAKVGEREILKGINLTVNAGEVHAIMGPNGSGKSTLAQVLSGREMYVVTSGSVTYDGKDLLELSPEDRAREGIFLAFQYPVEIPGVSNMYFLKAALNAIRKHRGIEELDAMDFLNVVREKMQIMKMDQALLNRPVNTGFSGGEKKRNEIFQMAVLEPRLAILDETDSGLDIDALRTVAGGVNAMRSPDRGMVVVTHYQRLLSEIVPDFVHVLAEGRIVKSGGKELALELEAEGYAGSRACMTSRRRLADYDRCRGNHRRLAWASSLGAALPAAPAWLATCCVKLRVPALRLNWASTNTHNEEWRFTNVAPIARTNRLLRSTRASPVPTVETKLAKGPVQLDSPTVNLLTRVPKPCRAGPLGQHGFADDPCRGRKAPRQIRRVR